MPRAPSGTSQVACQRSRTRALAEGRLAGGLPVLPSAKHHPRPTGGTMRRTPTLILAVLASAGLALAGCGSTTTPAPASSSAAAFPATAGGVTLKQRPTHIVS